MPSSFGILNIRIILLFLTICVGFFGKSSQAQNIKLVTLKTIEAIDNNSLANVRSILQDRYGFAWIASQDGLIRFDGRNGLLYSKNSPNLKQAISNNDIDAMLPEQGTDFMWVISSYGGIEKINLKTTDVEQRIRFSSGKPNSQNYFFRGFELSGDSIYTCTQEGIFFSVSRISGQWKQRAVSIGRYGNTVEKFLLWKEKILLFLDSGNLLVLNPAELSVEQVIRLSYKRIYAVSGTLMQELIVGTDNGIFNVSVKMNRITCQDFSSALFAGVPVTSLLSHGEDLYIGSTKGLYVMSASGQGPYSIYRASKGKEENRWLMNSTYMNWVDDQLWVGNEFGVAAIKKHNPFTPFLQDYESEKKLAHVFSLYLEKDHLLHIATSAGYYRLNTESLELKQIGKPSYIISCFPGIRNETVLSGFDGTKIVEGEKLIPISTRYPALKVLDSEPVIPAVVYRDSMYFFASFYGKGIYCYDSRKEKLELLNQQSSPIRLSQTTITNLFLAKNRFLWILTDNRVDVIDIWSWTIKSHELLSPHTQEPLNIIKDMCQVKDLYYLAVYGVGIIELDSDMRVRKVIAQKEGIENINLYKIFPIGDSALITTSNNGAYVYNTLTGDVKSYFSEDGLNSNGFEQFSGYMHKGRCIIGGIDGLTIVDLQKIKENSSPPRLYFNKISIERLTGKTDSANLAFKKMVIPNDALQTTVYLSGINWSNPGRTTFSWRITENGEKWTDIGTQNSIPLIAIKAGIYHLQVKAANEDGIWSEPKELVLEFLPKWYQTWWFKLLIILATAGIIYAFYRYRIGQIKKQHEIRKNIATDLHDDLGSTLNSVKVFTNLAIRGVNQEESLQQIKDNLSEATLGLRDMIWVLDDSLDTVEELVIRLKQFALPIATASNMEATITAGSDVSKLRLSKEEKRNLFLVCKEAINNSIKYSAASRLYVSVTPMGKKIKISITDDGKGFDVESGKTGYGLKNMKYRAGQVKYAITISSAQGQGTTIEINPD